MGQLLAVADWPEVEVGNGFAGRQGRGERPQKAKVTGSNRVGRATCL